MDPYNLRDELLKVHQELAKRNNASTNAVIVAAQVGKDFFTAVASALLTLGETHAPLRQTARFLTHPDPVDYADRLYVAGLKIPGWGSAFVKEDHDPAFDRIKNILEENYSHVYSLIDDVTYYLHYKGTDIYPNAACYTTAVLIALGLDLRFGPQLLINGRIGWWQAVYLDNYSPGPA